MTDREATHLFSFLTVHFLFHLSSSLSFLPPQFSSYHLPYILHLPVLIRSAYSLNFHSSLCHLFSFHLPHCLLHFLFLSPRVIFIHSLPPVFCCFQLFKVVILLCCDTSFDVVISGLVEFATYTISMVAHIVMTQLVQS